MGSKNRSMILPRSQKASRLFAFIKIALVITLAAYLTGLLGWTFYVVGHYKTKMREATKGHIRYRHHSHFFLLTGLYIASVTAFGLWATLKENLRHCHIFVVLSILGFLFEMIGAHKSKDEEVKQLKYVTLIAEPVILIISLVFSRLVHNQTKDLIYSPYYRRRMADSPRNSSDEDLSDFADTLTLVPNNSDRDRTQSLQRKHPFQSIFG